MYKIYSVEDKSYRNIVRAPLSEPLQQKSYTEIAGYDDSCQDTSIIELPIRYIGMINTFPGILAALNIKKHQI